jgi:hypothetical protein
MIEGVDEMENSNFNFSKGSFELLQGLINYCNRNLFEMSAALKFDDVIDFRLRLQGLENDIDNYLDWLTKSNSFKINEINKAAENSKLIKYDGRGEIR